MSKIKQFFFEKSPTLTVQPIRSEIRFSFLEDGNHTVNYLADGSRIWIEIKAGKLENAGMELPNGGNIPFEKARTYFFPPERGRQNWFRSETWVGQGIRLVVESEVMYDGESEPTQTFEPFVLTLLVSHFGLS